MFLFEIIIFPLSLIFISIIKNPYIVGLTFALTYGYYHSRKELMDKYYLDKFCFNKNYKATMISIKNQIANLFQAIFSFGVGYLMILSYEKGFLISGIILFGLLIISYFAMLKNLKK